VRSHRKTRRARLCWPFRYLIKKLCPRSSYFCFYTTKSDPAWTQFLTETVAKVALSRNDTKKASFHVSVILNCVHINNIIVSKSFLVIFLFYILCFYVPNLGLGSFPFCETNKISGSPNFQ
jgi:hypothetical protein